MLRSLVLDEKRGVWAGPILEDIIGSVCEVVGGHTRPTERKAEPGRVLLRLAASLDFSGFL